MAARVGVLLAEWLWPAADCRALAQSGADCFRGGCDRARPRRSAPGHHRAGQPPDRHVPEGGLLGALPGCCAGVARAPDMPRKTGSAIQRRAALWLATSDVAVLRRALIPYTHLELPVNPRRFLTPRGVLHHPESRSRRHVPGAPAALRPSP